ncbi:MAG: asparagine--tRNA ligase, partial [Bdellovibrionales bacterium]|nr:asparagine--tRNA ligase [Bdellovibrionales bacterium]
MKTASIRDVHRDKVSLGEYVFCGWVKTHRQSKNVSFIELSDGTSVKGLQVVIEPSNPSYSKVAAAISTGASVKIKGELIESPGKGQKYEFQASDVELVGQADPEVYPLQKKG